MRLDYSSFRYEAKHRPRRAAFTLVEVLVAAAASLLLMGLVVQIFAFVGNTVSDTRATIQTVDRLRAARQTLQSDLAGVTCRLAPPLNPIDGEGYLEIIEGPIGSRLFPAAAPMVIANGTGLSVGTTSSAVPGTAPGDTTLGDTDDILMFTTHTDGAPFTGRLMVPYQNAAGGYSATTTTTLSQDAEVAWFLRGNTLYRRMLLIKPGVNLLTAPGYYASNDVSARQVGGSFSKTADPYGALGGAFSNSLSLVANSLGDLTNRQNRYAHQPFAFPHDARFWGPLGLPTLRDCSYFTASGFVWPFPFYDPTLANLQGQVLVGANGPILFPVAAATVAPYSVLPPSGTVPAFPQIPQLYITAQGGQTSVVGQFDPWPPLYQSNNTSSSPVGTPWDQTDLQTGTLRDFSAYGATTNPPINSRIAEDVVLTNVLSFDVRVWDPDAPVVGYVGLDGAPGILGIDDDFDGVVDNPSEVGAAGSDDIVLAPGDIYVPPPGFALPPGIPPANAWGYGASVGSLAKPNNWTNWQYLTILNYTANTPPSAYIIRRGAYVDLCYGQNPASGPSGLPYALTFPNTSFAGPGNFRSQLWAGGTLSTGQFVMPAVYDTGSTSYEDDGLDQDVITAAYQSTLLGYVMTPILSFGPDQGRNQVDDNLVLGPDDTTGEPYTDVNGNGLFDPGDPPIAGTPADINGNAQYDPEEMEAPPPYRVPLRGIQVKIRVFDPDSRQIREVTIVQEYDSDN